MPLPRPACFISALLLACAPRLPADTDTSGGTIDTTAPTTDVTDTPTTGGASSTTGCDALDCQTSGGAARECDFWKQDCPEGQKCMPYANDGGPAWNDLKCTDVMPNAGEPGDVCTAEGNGLSGVDSCEKGAMCWNISPSTGKGTCAAMCTGSPESPTCPDPTDYCSISGDGILIVCLTPCNPLAPDCPNTQLCLAYPPDLFICVLDASGDAGQQNDPCDQANACDPGLFCANPALASECDPMAAGCCLPFCDLSNPQCTNQGATCLPWYDMGTAPPGFENLGVCGLPQ